MSIFQGKKVTVTRKRIPEIDRLPEFHYYEMRHSDKSQFTPYTIEKGVIVDFCGTLITTEPIILGVDNYIDLQKRERNSLRSSLMHSDK